MRLTLQNHIVCADYGQVHLDARVVGQIMNYTAETWQPDRPKKERECNIEQGKIAEEITERFIRQYYSQELSLKTYDEIRNDDFKKHAPFDFLLWKTGTVNIAFIEEAIRQDIARTPNKFVKTEQCYKAVMQDIRREDRRSKIYEYKKRFESRK